MKSLDEDEKLVCTENRLYRKLFLYENKGSIPETIWDNCSNNANAKDEIKVFLMKLFLTRENQPHLSSEFFKSQLNQTT